MYIKDIIDHYCNKHYKFGSIEEIDSLKLECLDYVIHHLDKCNLDMDVKSYVAVLVISYFKKARSKKIDDILEVEDNAVT